MERTEIIKALECCVLGDCAGCPYHQFYLGCRDRMSSDALSLIKELTEKVENYRNELGEVRVALAEANNDKKELTEENERLRGCVKSKEEVEAIMRATYEPLVKEITKEQIDKAVADTVRKMQEQLKMEIDRFGRKDGFITKETVRWFIDQIAKETEESVDEA